MTGGSGQTERVAEKGAVSPVVVLLVSGLVLTGCLVGLVVVLVISINQNLPSEGLITAGILCSSMCALLSHRAIARVRRGEDPPDLISVLIVAGVVTSALILADSITKLR